MFHPLKTRSFEYKSALYLVSNPSMPICYCMLYSWPLVDLSSVIISTNSKSKLKIFRCWNWFHSSSLRFYRDNNTYAPLFCLYYFCSFSRWHVLINKICVLRFFIHDASYESFFCFFLTALPVVVCVRLRPSATSHCGEDFKHKILLQQTHYRWYVR